MKFSLRNMLLAIIFLAASLGVLLSDSDPKLKSQAAHIQQQHELIERSKQFHLPVTKAEVQAYQLGLDKFAQR